MSKKGDFTTSDYLPYEDYKRLVQTLINEQEYYWATYCMLAFCTGLRFSDLSRLTWDDVLDKRNIIITAQKTGKIHNIGLGQSAQDNLMNLYKKMGNPSKKQLILKSAESDNPVAIQVVNRKLKEFKYKYDLNCPNFSTHSFRKTFGRYVYDKQGRTDQALMYLNRIFRHTNLNTTLIYLGIRDEEVYQIYNSIEV